MDENNTTPPEPTPPDTDTTGPATHGSSPSEPLANTPQRGMLGQTTVRRVMQPSASFVREMQDATKSEQATTRLPAPERPIQPAETPVAEVAEPALRRPAHDVIAVPPPAIGQSRKPDVPEKLPEVVGTKNILILAAIYTLGTIVTLVAGYTLYAWVKIGIHNVGHGLGLAMSLLTIVVGIGLLRRRDIARATYIFIAIIGLALSLFGTVRVYNAQRSLQKDLPIFISRLQAGEDTLRSSSDASDSATKQLLSAYDQQILDLKGQQGNVVTKTASALTRSAWPYYLATLLPLAFLTRSSVKAKFN